MPHPDTNTAASRAGSGKGTVLQVVPRLVMGGVERGTIDIAAALVAYGWNAVVASEGGPMARELARVGATHVALPLASKNPFVIRSNIDRLVKVIVQHDVDIVHARSRAPAWSARYAAERTGRHFVTTFHNAYAHGSFVKRRYNAVMAAGERVIAISQFVANHVASIYGVGPDRLRLIPRGVDLARFDPDTVSPERLVRLMQAWRLADGAQTVLLPGRLTRWKGQLVFIEALARLARRDVNAVILGAGDAGYRRELEKAVAATGGGATFRFLDDCADMAAAYMLADVVVSASTEPEGFGRVIIEAQAMGRPVIATSHGGAQETITPGDTGWLVPPGDAAALAAALAQALDQDPAVRQAMSQREIAHVRAHFTSSLMAARTLTVYRELMPQAAEATVAA
ncbi:MAG TPA: glycosyltransferase family 4 protein [Stellaceae bacterium]|jgi:glycosyltransferase involved in cell wall biosynthesis|nr:glycosyltransferase family 4 protein [Stellaceae bacterium]